MDKSYAIGFLKFQKCFNLWFQIVSLILLYNQIEIKRKFYIRA